MRLPSDPDGNEWYVMRGGLVGRDVVQICVPTNGYKIRISARTQKLAGRFS